MRELDNLSASITNGSDDLKLAYATTPQEIEAVQRLRYQVYTQEMGVKFPNAVDGVDADPFDPWCKHLMVIEPNQQKVVGTYRILPPSKAIKAGGYYSESEFDLSEFASMRDQLSECGRSCTHPDYRSGAAILLLWSGLAHFLKEHNLRYMLGCASVSLADGGKQAAEVWHMAQKSLKEYEHLPKAYPLIPYPLENITPSQLEGKVPPLIKGYLKLGARICGEPAWDKDFNAADFPVLVDVELMEPRYKKHFGLD